MKKNIIILALTFILPIHVYSNHSIVKLGIPLIITGSYLVNKHIHDFYQTVDLQTQVIQIQLKGQPARLENMKTISHYLSSMVTGKMHLPYNQTFPVSMADRLKGGFFTASTALVATGTLYEIYLTSKNRSKKADLVQEQVNKTTEPSTISKLQYQRNN